MITKLVRVCTMTLAMTLMAFSSISHAQSMDNEPNAAEMAADAVIARPLLLATTVVGTAVYIVSLPFSLLGGNAADAGEKLVLGPARSTFVRCLGCIHSGRKQDTVGAAD
ncbi:MULTISPECIES: hypothetical protein [Marinobacter]|uniref:hypothetical protein n=1 Tax=Marinobacter TaxID=2742 RepID=UPI000DAD160C|nr:MULTISPECIES: hypothetical protein [Marinobacter]